MIFHRGHQAPSRAQVAEAVQQGTDDFCTSCSKEFALGLPKFEDRAPDSLPILLKLKTVEPHDDPWTGGFDGEPHTVDRRSIFWLLKGELHIQVANEYASMKAGDFIVFNDALVHSVVATKSWAGSAWQLKKLPKEQVADTAYWKAKITWHLEEDA